MLQYRLAAFEGTTFDNHGLGGTNDLQGVFLLVPLSKSCRTVNLVKKFLL